MKYRNALVLVFLVIFIDQAIKVYIKTHFYNGEEIKVIGNWCRLHFLENEGMAFGLKISETSWGKLVLTLFRLIAVFVGFGLLKKLVKDQYSKGLIICGSLILAGAMGNLLDSMFYGLIFSDSPFTYHFTTIGEVAHYTPIGKGYAPFLHGKVVDMFYFPITDITLPQIIPFIGGKSFQFFEPVFNLADAAISTGVLILVFFQKSIVKKIT